MAVGQRHGLDGARIGIRILLAQLDALRPIRQQLEDQIQSLADQLPGYLLTVPGAAPLRTVSLFGETDPFEAFPSPTQLVAFAGLDLTVFQTGQYDTAIMAAPATWDLAAGAYELDLQIGNPMGRSLWVPSPVWRSTHRPRREGAPRAATHRPACRQAGSTLTAH